MSTPAAPAPSDQIVWPTLNPATQEPAMNWIVSHPMCAIWLKIGGGKCLTVLSALRAIRPAGHILVIAPLMIARSTWLDEIEKWGASIRTKSLIVDEQDRKLSLSDRVAGFRAIATDPPTMYFINQDMITRPSVLTTVIETVPSTVPLPALGDVEQKLLHTLAQLIKTTGPVTVEELTTTCLDLARSAGAKLSKKSLHDAIRLLKKEGVLRSVQIPCRACDGVGCPQCKHGLIDQLPVVTVNGQQATQWPFQTVIIDESQEWKSHESKRFQALAAMRPGITRLIELSGTPSPESFHDLWAQIYLLDGGAALGSTITEYRERWFTPKMIPGTTTPSKWEANEGAEEEIIEAISHLAMTATDPNQKYTPPEITPVPVVLEDDLMQRYKKFRRDLVLDVVNNAVFAQAHDGARRWILESPEPEAVELRRQLVAAADDAMLSQLADMIRENLERFVTAPSAELMTTVVALNKAVLSSKLSQFANGTLYTSDPDLPETKGRYEVLHEEKLTETIRLIHSLQGSPALLAYHFKSDRIEILRALTEAGIHVEAFDGSRSMTKRWNQKQIQVMLIHPLSAGAGLNLQVGGSTLIWYTLPFALRLWLQTIGRVDRMGQADPVRIFMMLTKGTQDDRMPSMLRIKELRQQRLMTAVDINRQADDLATAVVEEVSDDIAALVDDWRLSQL